MLSIKGDDEIAGVVKTYGNEIAAVTLADCIDDKAEGEPCDINGKNVVISVKKI